MGKLLKNVAIGLAIGYAVRRANQAVSTVISQIKWTIDKIRRKDLSLGFKQGKLVAYITVRLIIENKSKLSIYLQSYEAKISQGGKFLSDLKTDASIELPANETRTLAATFEVVGENFVQRLEKILSGNGSIMTPIEIEGIVTLSKGPKIPLNQTLEFFALT